MAQAEVQRLLSFMEGKPALMAKLIYGKGNTSSAASHADM